MPKGKFSRRNRNRRAPSGARPSDIDNMIQGMNQESAHPSLIKFMTYAMESKLYGIDCHDEFVKFCLSSYFLLKDHYTTFSFMFDLPPDEFLEEEALRDFKFCAGISPSILELIKIKTEHLEPLEKVCVLIVDEMALKPEANGEVGFEDNGGGGQWLLPLAYYFTEKSCPAASLKDYVSEAVSKLDDIGLDIVGVVTKMRTNLYELSQLLNIIRSNQTFKVGEKDVVFLYDVPQLMNITRNIMMKYTLRFDDKYTSWKFIKQCFKNDSQGAKRTKLTPAHVKPSKNQMTCAKLAIELMSNSVATEMESQISQGKLPESAVGTAECLDKFDKLFDILNSTSKVSMNEYCNAYRGSKHQLRFMGKMVEFFENLRVFDGSNQDCTEQVKFINGWLISIKGMMKMWEILNKKKYPFLLTRNINCESLDKFTWLVRWQLFTLRNPTPSSFLELYSTFFASVYFQQQPNDDARFDIGVYAKKMFERIPPVRHDISGKTRMPNVAGNAKRNRQLGGCSSRQQSQASGNVSVKESGRHLQEFPQAVFSFLQPHHDLKQFVLQVQPPSEDLFAGVPLVRTSFFLSSISLFPSGVFLQSGSWSVSSVSSSVELFSCTTDTNHAYLQRLQPALQLPYPLLSLTHLPLLLLLALSQLLQQDRHLLLVRLLQLLQLLQVHRLRRLVVLLGVSHLLLGLREQDNSLTLVGVQQFLLYVLDLGRPELDVLLDGLALRGLGTLWRRLERVQLLLEGGSILQEAGQVVNKLRPWNGVGIRSARNAAPQSRAALTIILISHYIESRKGKTEQLCVTSKKKRKAYCMVQA
ncbi:hypothetical protein NQ318_013260 [Aromia moschata]|uniref:Transposable element P transposase-like GTP-binding insertion domain-containing protein n=1 Tax=Aromia moschata TaxID=1265417 RepID=A0AAV8XT86_9CUCU|nr:hypothetical protein NQ318_013260 [Aromia moschata]